MSVDYFDYDIDNMLVIFEQSLPGEGQQTAPQETPLDTLNRFFVLNKLIDILYQLKGSGVEDDNTDMLEMFIKLHTLFQGKDFYDVVGQLLQNLVAKLQTEQKQ